MLSCLSRYLIKSSFRQSKRLSLCIRLHSTGDNSGDGEKQSDVKQAGQTASGVSAGEVSGFAEAMHRFEQLDKGKRDQIQPASDDESGIPGHDATQDMSFTSLLRQSKLMQIGDPSGRIVVGTVNDIVDDDLYIDFGGKFHCVCKRPQYRESDYTRGARVKLILHDFEMTSSFLGAQKHVTLLEADGTLIGLHRNQRILLD